jgi:hypothetical protein
MAGKSVQERNKILRERSTERERKRMDNAETRSARSFAEEENCKREARFQQRGHRGTEGTEKTGSFENSRMRVNRERAVKKDCDGQKIAMAKMKPAWLRNSQSGRPNQMAVTESRSWIRQVAPRVVEVAVAGGTGGVVASTAEEPELMVEVNPVRPVAAAARRPDFVCLIWN